MPWRRAHPPLYVLAALVAAGVALRVAMLLAYQPALVGYPDTHIYLVGARDELFWPPMHVVGYSALLRGLHWVWPSLGLVAVVQHLLGIATALLLFAATRRIAGSPWPALVPAAVVLLGGDQVFFEHAILSETLFTFVLAAAVYAAARCLDAGRLGWVLAAGALVALAGTVRLAGVALVPVLAVWLLAVPAPSWRRRFVRALAAAGAAAAILVPYLVAAHAQTGEWSFARRGAYNLYGRVAGFADCKRFDPPAGTRRLCETAPPSERYSPQWYIFDWGSPALRAYGEPQLGRPRPEDVDKLAAFARAAAVAQPLDWLDAATTDFARYVNPGNYQRLGPTPSARDYPRLLVHPLGIARVVPDTQGWYRDAVHLGGDRGVQVRSALWTTLGDWEKATSVEGPLMAILLALSAGGLVVLRGRRRRGAALVLALALVTMAVPVATLNYDGRFGIPAHGLVAASGALGAAGLADAARRLARARSRRSRAPARGRPAYSR